ncbi:MAG TPA: DUF4412 domain-containing protein [Tenuifilaceae bacterium]|nr:DUF4412 domain-containing protein [Tenuifilaceae bacterium]HPE18971.1 DUF4412 domain-containing protein [Tenuifilaceae bacterium]HPJ46352.1 DUF4412 domain-containing protein [Tenuifilaceae bacterium]HPQ34812.1 DUF4412 domain-containing protein [Tenuifilaceae bacterium]HRX68497.1 DUF4412 domain-containing protein [Tenuifilaceae bacterium]
MRKFLLLILVSISIHTLAQNGWHIKTRFYNEFENPANARIEEVFLQNSFMKMVAGDVTTIFDVGKSEIIYYNTNNQTYWKGNPDRFNVEVRAELEVMIEEKLNGVEADQKEAMRQVYYEMLNASFPESMDTEVEHRDFSAQKGGAGEKVSGFSTIVYNIYEGGMPLETIWVAPTLQIANDFDFVSLSQFLNQLARGAYAASFESSQEYFDMIQVGYPVKIEMTKSDGYTYVSEVVEATRISMNANDFSLPTGYTPGTLSDVGVWNGF